MHIKQEFVIVRDSPVVEGIHQVLIRECPRKDAGVDAINVNVAVEEVGLVLAYLMKIMSTEQRLELLARILNTCAEMDAEDQILPS